MVLLLPGGGQLVGGLDRGLGLEAARDEGAYHPGPPLGKAPPPLRSPQLSAPQRGLERSPLEMRGEPRGLLGDRFSHAAPPQLGGQASRSPASFGRSKLDEPLRQPHVVHQVQLRQPLERALDLLGGAPLLRQPAHQLDAEVIAAGEHLERGLVRLVGHGPQYRIHGAARPAVRLPCQSSDREFPSPCPSPSPYPCPRDSVSDRDRGRVRGRVRAGDRGQAQRQCHDHLRVVLQAG